MLLARCWRRCTPTNRTYGSHGGARCTISDGAIAGGSQSVLRGFRAPPSTCPDQNARGLASTFPTREPIRRSPKWRQRMASGSARRPIEVVGPRTRQLRLALPGPWILRMSTSASPSQATLTRSQARFDGSPVGIADSARARRSDASQVSSVVLNDVPVGLLKQLHILMKLVLQ
jgi:hypothetical protein